MSVEIDLVRDRIYLRSAQPTPGLGKKIAGANFSKVGGPHWSIPLTIEACQRLRSIFGGRLKVGTELAAWYRGEAERRADMAALGKAADADLERVPLVSPVLARAMDSRTYQRVGARFIAAGQAVLIADQPGLGKTLEAIGGIIESGIPGPYLVVCPKTAVETVWAREIPRWWPGARAVTVPDGRAKREEILDWFTTLRKIEYLEPGGGIRVDLDPSTAFLVVHPEMLRTRSYWICPFCGGTTQIKNQYQKQLKDCCIPPRAVSASEIKRQDVHDFPQLFSIDWGAIIVDESHQVLIRKTGTPTLARAGAEMLPSRPNALRVAMSGTPMRGKPHLLWGTLNWLRPDHYRSFWRWAETYYEMNDSGWGGGKEIGGLLPNMEGKLYDELSGIMLRRTKAEVAADMPVKSYVGSPLDSLVPNSPVGVWLPMDPKQQKAYDQMVETSMASIDGGDLNAIGILAEMTRMKQFATACGRLTDGVFQPILPSNKFEYICEILEELGFPDDPETKVVIGSQFTQVLNLFAAEFKARKMGYPCLITGEVTGKNRQETIARFNEPAAHAWTPNIMLLQTKTGGVAITLDSADHTFIVDETWIPDDQEQLEDRTHRVSRPRQVFYHYLRSLGTIDEHIAAVNAERGAATREQLDERRGIEYARQVVERLKK